MYNWLNVEWNGKAYPLAYTLPEDWSLLPTVGMLSLDYASYSSPKGTKGRPLRAIHWRECRQLMHHIHGVGSATPVPLEERVSLPKPSTLNPKPLTLNPKIVTLNPKP